MKRRLVVATASLVGSIACGHSATPRGDAVPKPTAEVRCSDGSPFHTSSARLLVGRFGGSDAESGETSELIASALQRFDEERDASAKHRLFEVVRVSDKFSSHDEARACAEHLHADAVLWGSLVKNPQAAVPTVIETHVDVGSITAGDRSTIRVGNIDLGAKPFTLIPSVTLRRKNRWLMSSSRLDLFSLADVDFQAIASDRSLFFVPFLAGTLAFEHGQKEEALAMFGVANDGSLHSTGTPRLYTSTYLGAIYLSSGDLARAVAVLDVPQEDIAAAPATVSWNNRLLLALAREESGSLRAALSAYKEAAALDERVDEGQRGLAGLAGAWVQLRIGDTEGAIATIEGLEGRFPRCTDDDESRCFIPELRRLRRLTIGSIALAILGDRDALTSCVAETEMAVVRWDQAARRGKGFDVSTMWTPLSPDEVPTFMQITGMQSGGCVLVHSDLDLGLDLKSARDMSAVWDRVRQGQGTVGAMLQKVPPQARNGLMANLTCMSGLVLARFEPSEVIPLVDEALTKLDSTAPALTRTELELVKARALVRWAESSKQTARLDEAASIVRRALPVLRASMGDSPNVRTWESFLSTHKLPTVEKKHLDKRFCGH